MEEDIETRVENFRIALSGIKVLLDKAHQDPSFLNKPSILDPEDSNGEYLLDVMQILEGESSYIHRKDPIKSREALEEYRKLSHHFVQVVLRYSDTNLIYPNQEDIISEN